MREMRDRAAILYVTVGPSPIGTPVNDDRSAPGLGLTPVPIGERAQAERWARWAAGPKVETPSMRKYRQAFHPTPAPTTRLGKLGTRLAARVSSWL